MRTRLLAIGVLLVALLGLRLLGQTDPALLTFSDLSNGGCFLGPFTDTGPYTGVLGPHGMARRQSDGHWFIFSGNAHIYEFAESPLVTPCPSDLTTLTPAPVLHDYGPFPAMDASAGGYPGGTGWAVSLGLTYLDSLNWLCLSWAQTYTDQAQRNSFGCATLSGSTLTTVGCWFTSNPITNQGSTGSGMVEIPAAFRTKYGLGTSWIGLGFGGTTGAAKPGASEGLSLTAINQPAPNSCTGGIDHDAGVGTNLIHYPQNYLGPTCGHLNISGFFLGCGTWATKPPQYVAPSTPTCMETSFVNYSMSAYGFLWDPYNGKGCLGEAVVKAAWYDDGSKQGILMPFLMPEGWMNTGVMSSPAPSVNGTTYSFRVADLSTHDGQTLRAGDLFWVETCDPLLDGPNCESTNGRNVSFAIADSVSAAGDVTYHNTGSDFGNGTTNHLPRPGGHVYLGYTYFHGAPAMSRGHLGCQMLDPNQLGQVAQGTRKSYEVRYSEDIDCSSLLPGFGPIVPTVTSNGTSIQRGPWAVVPDAANKRIYVALGGAKLDCCVDPAPVIHVLNVGAGTDPIPTPQPPNPTPSPSPSPTPTPTPTPIPPPPTDPCVVTPLRVTVTQWPTGQTGSKQGRWNSGTFTLTQAAFKWSPQRFEGFDTRGCAVTVRR